jgi:hypothetical protein
MERLVIKEAAVAFPVCKADATGAQGVHYITGINAAGSQAIPSGMAGRWVRVVPYGGGVQVGVSLDGAHTLVWNQPAALGTGSGSAGDQADDSGGPRWIEGVIPLGATHLNYVPETGKTIALRIICTELVDWSV